MCYNYAKLYAILNSYIKNDYNSDELAENAIQLLLNNSDNENTIDETMKFIEEKILNLSDNDKNEITNILKEELKCYLKEQGVFIKSPLIHKISKKNNYSNDTNISTEEIIKSLNKQECIANAIKDVSEIFNNEEFSESITEMVERLRKGEEINNEHERNKLITSSILFDELEPTVCELQKQINKNNTTITNLNNQINTINNRVDKLEKYCYTHYNSFVIISFMLFVLVIIQYIM